MKKRLSQLTIPQWVSTATEPCTCAEQWTGRKNVAIENVYKASMWSSWQCRLLVLENGMSLLIFVAWRCNSNELYRETERCTPILKYHMGRRENYLYKSGWKLEIKAAKNCVRKIREQSFKTLESIFLWYFCFLHRK